MLGMERRIQCAPIVTAEWAADASGTVSFNCSKSDLGVRFMVRFKTAKLICFYEISHNLVSSASVAARLFYLHVLFEDAAPHNLCNKRLKFNILS